MTAVVKPWVVVVGGFLGAGKTSLLMAAAKELKKRGLRSAVVMNDQGQDLVDSAYAGSQDLEYRQVTGGCFCCRFSQLMEEMDYLRAYSPDVIFAEPVGSCTDISATTLQPLREYTDSYTLAPFTVLADPARAKALMSDDADEDLSFLFRKQLQEADVVCFTKADLGFRLPEVGSSHVRQLSAKTGQGVAAWLDEILSGTISAGTKILNIDYQQYARAEAALAWLNLQANLSTSVPTSSAMLLGPLLDSLDHDFTEAGISIVHLKAIMNSPSGFLKAAVCANGQEPVVDGALDASPSASHSLLLNLRAVGAADEVREITERNIGRINASVTNLKVACFHPAAPQPQHRIVEVR